MERYHVYDKALMDNPSLWNQEGTFFGLAQDESDTSVPWYESITKAISPIATAALNVYQQSQLQKANSARIAQGLAPIAPAEYAQMYPTATAQVGLTPDTKRLLLYGALGLGAFLVVKLVLKR
jgi:hypothetical protein